MTAKSIVAIISSLAVVACGTTKKVVSTPDLQVRTDTAIVVEHKDSLGPLKDTAVFIREVFEKVVKNKIAFNTFNSKVRVTYSNSEEHDEANAFIRIRKDSAIWMSFRGALGIEGLRVLITPDSVKIMNPLKKFVQFRSIGYLQQITDIPVDFSAMQDVLIGNPVFTNLNLVSYDINDDKELLVLMTGDYFRQLVTISDTTFLVKHCELTDVNNDKGRSCSIAFGEYDFAQGFAFSTKRKIQLAGKTKAGLDMDFKQYSFNQPVNFPFNVPANYKRL